MSRRLDAATGPAPRHDGSVLRYAAFENLVPADQTAAAVTEPFLDPADQITLQFGLVPQPLPTDTFLTERTRFPAFARRFIPADVNIFRRKEFENFGQHILQESERRLFADAQNVLAHAPRPHHFIRTSGAPEPGISRQCRHGMTGHLDFGNHHNTPFGRIGHDFADLVLRIVAAVRFVRILGRGPMVADNRPAAYGTGLGQSRVTANLDPPTLIVGQMPMKDIEFVQGKDVDKPLDLANG